MLEFENLLISLLYLFFCFFLFYYLYIYWTNLSTINKNLDGPIPWPLIGSAHLFLGNKKFLLNRFYNFFIKYPESVKIWFGPLLFYCIQTPEHIETVLKSNNSVSKIYFFKYVKPIFGEGLFTAPVDIWRKHRKIISPTFNAKILDSFVKILSEQSLILCDKLKNLENKSNIDVLFHFNDCTFSVICETLLGSKIDDKTRITYLHLMDRLLEITYERLFNIFCYADFIFNLTPNGKEYNKLLKQLKKITSNILYKKMDEFNKTELNKNQKSVGNNLQNTIFLDHLINNLVIGNNLTEQEVQDEIDTILFAGSDTTGTTMSFICCMLGMHKDIQQKVYEEVIDILGTRKFLETSDLSQLKYTECVIKETLRLFPPGIFIFRNITDKIYLNDNITLQNGTTAIIGIGTVHRNPNYWPDPLKFNPDRFQPEFSTNRHPYSYLPFLGGSRNCIGINFAMRILKVMTAMLVKDFYFQTQYKNIEDIKLYAHLVSKPLDGFKVTVQCRQ